MDNLKYEIKELDDKEVEDGDVIVFSEKDNQNEFLNFPLLIYSHIYKQKLLTHNDYIFKENLKHNLLWEPEISKLMEYYFLDGTDILDIGAHIGLTTLGFKLLLKNKKVNKIHCFECNNKNLNCLLYNLQNHNDVNIYSLGLSDSFSMVNMTINNFNTGCNTITKIRDIKNNININYKYSFFDEFKKNYETQGNIFIPIVSLDEIECYFENKVSVIKVDIEGFEVRFLKGAKKFLEKHRPVIIIEIFENNIEECNEILKIYNYKLLKKIEFELSSDYIFIP